MAQIEADTEPRSHRATGRSRSPVVTRRNLARVAAALLALLGVVALVVRPQRDTRAEARVAVPRALDLNEVMRAIRADRTGATATVDGRRITVAFTDGDAFVARTYVKDLATGGLDSARKQQTAVQTKRAEAARADSAEATAEIAAIATRTGISDPESVYRDRVQAGRELEAQRAAAVAAGRPLTDIDNAIAVNQQEIAELQLQVTRHDELTNAINAADNRALDATRSIDATDRAVRAASVRVTEHETGFGFGILPGVALLVLAAIVLLVNELVPRRAASRDKEVDMRKEPMPDVRAEPEPPAPIEPMPPGSIEPVVPVATVPAPAPIEPMPTRSDRTTIDDDALDSTRFSRFFRALDPSAPPLEIDVTSSVDLVEEEIREVKGDLEQQGVVELPQDAGDAKATRFSR